MLSRTTSLVQGITAFVVLAGLQFVLTWMLVRRPSLSRFVTTVSRILLWNGELRRDAMRRERVPESEIRTAIRARGISDITKVVAVVLETDGNFSVLQQPLSEVEADSSLSGIDR